MFFYRLSKRDEHRENKVRDLGLKPDAFPSQDWKDGWGQVKPSPAYTIGREQASIAIPMKAHQVSSLCISTQQWLEKACLEQTKPDNEKTQAQGHFFLSF